VLDRPEVPMLFNGQFGVASAKQLRELGLSPSTISRARRRGGIVPLLPGVFVQAGVEPGFETRAMAAQLYCGPRSFLSGATAGALLGMRAMRRRRIDITRPATSRHTAPSWVRLRYAAFTAATDVWVLDRGLRVSCPLLTLFTLASALNEFSFHRAGEDAWNLGLIHPHEASAYLERIRRSGRGGVAVFEAWLEHLNGRERPSQSGLELDLIDAIRAVGLPEPTRQHPVRLLSGEIVHIDVAWPDLLLGVEPGHSYWHGGDLGVQRDNARFRGCNEVGWMIIPLDESMRFDLAGTARQVKQIYETRRRPPATG
jgi:hypothetical protein